MRFHEQDDVEFDDIEDIDMNEAYEEQDSFKDDGDKEMEDLEKVNDLENQNDELVEEEREVPKNEEMHEVSQEENETVRNVRKRVRGPTRMPKVWAQEKGDRIPILVNTHGQLVNDKRSQLTHFREPFQGAESIVRFINHGIKLRPPKNKRCLHS